jgi:virginiamycin B lyase
VRRAAVLLAVAAAFAVGAAPASAVTFREFSTLAPNTLPAGITTGPDGALWFAESGAAALGRVQTDGTLGAFPIGGGLNQPLAVTRGPDGALWFTDTLASTIGRMTTGGAVTRYPLPTASAAQDIVTGPDNNLYFTERSASKIGRITPTGTITEINTPSSSSLPGGITSGPDGALWFTEEAANQIGRVSTAGAFTEYPIPTPSSFPHEITTGPDGALYFTERDANKIGRITTAGVITEFPVPTAQALPESITNGPDGALWFTEGAAEQIGRMTPDGTISEYPLPDPAGGPVDITTGPDGGIWYTRNTDRVGRVDPTANPVVGQAVVVEPVSGTVSVRPPGSPGFVPLTAGQVIPTGSELDTTQGRVRLTSAVGTDTTATKTADFYEGRFKVTQPTASDAVTQATLSGPLGRCKQARAAKGAKQRHLWGDGKGSYTTKGRHGSATVRGTIWLVQDKCNGTTVIKVQQGTVIARDAYRHKNKTLSAGQKYVARPRRRR